MTVDFVNHPKLGVEYLYSMRKKYWVSAWVLLLSVMSFSGMAQEIGNHWILLSDRDDSSFSIDMPTEFLSQMAIERRVEQGIPIDNRDLPVNSNYVTQVTSVQDVVLLSVSKWFNAIAVSCTDEALMEISQLDFVLGTKQAHRLKYKNEIPLIEEKLPAHEARQFRLPINYGLSANQVMDLNGQTLHEMGFEGEDMVIAILDSGFDNVDSMSTLSSLFTDGRILSTMDFVDGDTQVYDAHSHGRYVLSCIAGIKENEAYGTATQASFHLLRTEDVSSETVVEEFNWIAGAEYADSVGADVLNTSLGYTFFDNGVDSYTYEDMDGNTAWITRGADIAASKGILVINSAGNSGSSDFYYIGAPADGDSVLAVGSVRNDSIRSSFSSFGPSFDGRVKPNVCAQGSGSIAINGEDQVVAINGTSFSSPILAGLATCLWQSVPEATNMEVFHAIEMSAHTFNAPSDSLGYGIPNFGLAHSLLTEMVSSLPESTFEEFRIFPNPVENELIINWKELKLTELIRVEAIDVRGRSMVLKITEEDDSSNRRSFDVGSLSRGSYVLRVETKETVLTKKFIKR